jgi:hypothetical protein
MLKWRLTSSSFTATLRALISEFAMAINFLVSFKKNEQLYTQNSFPYVYKKVWSIQRLTDFTFSSRRYPVSNYAKKSWSSLSPFSFLLTRMHCIVPIALWVYTLKKNRKTSFRGHAFKHLRNSLNCSYSQQSSAR